MTTNPRIQVSASQISQYQMCKRCWVAGYILKDRQPQTEAAAFGTRGHKLLEDYTTASIVPDPDKPWQFPGSEKIRFPGLSARKALKHIPGPGIGRAEHGFSIMVDGIKFTGYIDREWMENGEAWITDYKFTSSYQYALTPETLPKNIQAVVYSFKTILEKRVDEVNLHWVYILSTKNPTARSVTAKITKDEVKERLRPVLETCEEMIELRAKVEAQLKEGVSHDDIINSLPPTVQSCGRYAGCYYTNRCNLTPEQLIEGDFDSMDQNLLNKLTALGCGDNVKTDAPAPAPPKTTAAAPTPPAPKPSFDASQWIKTPETPAPNTKPKGDPEVQLNAPENYVPKTQPQTTIAKGTPVQIEEEDDGGLTNEEKDAIISVVRKVLDLL